MGSGEQTYIFRSALKNVGSAYLPLPLAGVHDVAKHKAERCKSDNWGL